MYISNINTYNNCYNSHIGFCSKNPNALIFKNEDFFVNINGYGKNKDWANSIKKTANNAVKEIEKGNLADKILSNIAKGVKIANGFCKDLRKRQHTGILRTERKGYGNTGVWEHIDLVTPIAKPYSVYEKKLRIAADNPFKSPFYDMQVAEIEKGNWMGYDIRIAHPDSKFINNALDRVGGKYLNLKKDYITKLENITEENLPKINSDIAEIRWILAHSMPWERGSDSISNVFTRALYKSMGIKSYPLKKDISLDLEAFCTPLNEYKQKFASYFEKEPEIVR